MSFDRPWLAALLLSLSACSKDRPLQESSSRPAQESSVAQPADYEGYHDAASCDGISGWGWDRNQPERAIKVDIFDGENWITTLLADQLRTDLIDAHKGNGHHAFVMMTPKSLRDGHPHVVTVKFHPKGVALDHSGQKLTCPPD